MDRLLRTPQAGATTEDHAEDRVMLPDSAVVDIIRAEQVSDYTLRLVFSDGAERVIDFGPFLRDSRNPLIRVFLDPQKFANFRVEDGNLIWDDYALCFPMADLYEGRV
jgi:hypothetical protein